MNAKSNKKAWMKGLKIAKEKIRSAVLKQLAKYGKLLLNDAQAKAEYQSFTGNTLTSLAFGLYENNSLQDVVFISGLKAPVRIKVQKGEYVYLEDPYEGEARGVRGKVDIRYDTGEETSIKALQKVRPRGGNGIIVTTGTEYSTFLENTYNLNVLSDTFLEAQNNALRDMKKWLDINKPIDKQ